MRFRVLVNDVAGSEGPGELDHVERAECTVSGPGALRVLAPATPAVGS